MEKLILKIERPILHFFSHSSPGKKLWNVHKRRSGPTSCSTMDCFPRLHKLCATTTHMVAPSHRGSEKHFKIFLHAVFQSRWSVQKNDITVWNGLFSTEIHELISTPANVRCDHTNRTRVPRRHLWPTGYLNGVWFGCGNKSTSVLTGVFLLLGNTSVFDRWTTWIPRTNWFKGVLQKPWWCSS